MPAFRNTFQVPARTPVCITPQGPHVAVRVQNQGPIAFHTQAGPSLAVAPTNLLLGSVLCEPGGGYSTDRPLSTMFPSEVEIGAAAHVWVFSESDSVVSVSANA